MGGRRDIFLPFSFAWCAPCPMQDLIVFHAAARASDEPSLQDSSNSKNLSLPPLCGLCVGNLYIGLCAYPNAYLCLCHWSLFKHLIQRTSHNPATAWLLSLHWRKCVPTCFVVEGVVVRCSCSLFLGHLLGRFLQHFLHKIKSPGVPLFDYFGTLFSDPFLKHFV